MGRTLEGKRIGRPLTPLVRVSEVQKPLTVSVSVAKVLQALPLKPTYNVAST